MRTSGKSLRIAIIAPYVSTPVFGDAHSRKGGVERYTIEIAKELHNLKLDVTLVAPADGGPEVSSEGIPVKYIPRIGMMMNAPLVNPMDLASAVKDFDILHTQGVFPLLCDLNPVMAKLNQAKSVITYHFEPTPKNLMENLASRIYGMTLAKMMRRHDRIIFTTRSYRQHVRLLGNHCEEKIRYVPSGADSIYFVPDPTVKVEDRFLFVGRLVPYKNLPVLLKAMAVVKKTLPRHELVIVGTGILEEELKEMAKKLEINVKFLGRVDDDTLRQLYRSSISTILPSYVCHEAFGAVLAESMSCGTPVIACDIPGVGEVASIGGRLVKPCSVDDLAKTMIDASQSHSTDREKWDLHAKIEENYSWKKVAGQLAMIYQELMT